MWYRLGEAARARGGIDNALVSITRALELDAHHMRARLARASVYVLRGEYAKARDDARVAREAAPDDAEATFLMWQVAMLQEDRQGTREAVAATLNPLK